MTYLDQYQKKGYLIVNDVYSSSEVDQIKEIVNNLDLEKVEHSKDKSGYPFRITNIIPKNNKLREIVEKEKAMAILEECIEDKVIFFKDKYISKQKGGRVFVPHTDGAFVTYNYRLKKETKGWWTYASKFIHLQIMVVDNTKKNGCLHICKRESADPDYYISKYFLNDRSKKSGEIDEKFHEDIKKRSVPVTGRKGAVLIFDPLCIHFSNQNETEDLRDLFLITYNRASDGDNFEISDVDKQNAIKHHKDFIDDQ